MPYILLIIDYLYGVDRLVIFCRFQLPLFDGRRFRNETHFMSTLISSSDSLENISEARVYAEKGEEWRMLSFVSLFKL